MFEWTLRELNQKADETTFQRDTLEKVLRLGDMLQFINGAEPLKDHLALKGGTAIHLTVFALLRLSVDIDLDCHVEATKDEMSDMRKRMSEIILRYLTSQGYRLSDASRYSHSLDSFVFQYRNLVGNPDIITIEINYSNRCHLFDPIHAAVITPVLDPFTILTLAPMDLFGSKIAALIGRTTPRDLYDVHRMITTGVFRPGEWSLLKRAAIFYLSLSIDDLHWSKCLDGARARIAGMSYHDIKRALIPVLKSSEAFDIKSAAILVNEFIERLFVLTEDDLKYVELFNQGEYQPQLLFSDASVVGRIINHPMAMWKARQRQAH